MITVEDHAGVGVVRIEHGKVNLLDLESVRELTATLERLTEANAVVLTGAGRAFSAGVDLRRVLDGGRGYATAFLPALTRTFHAVFDHPRPVVAAVNGHAIAGGCVIVAGCDWRVMSAGTIGVTELRVGVPFPPSALEALRFAVGPATARLVLTGQPLPPRDALAVGLVDEVVEPDALIDRAVERARGLARIPAETFTLTKSQLRREARERIEADERRYGDRLLDAWTSPAALHEIAGFLDQLDARRRAAPRES
jgi:enoyl-CoA hydratase